MEHCFSLASYQDNHPREISVILYDSRPHRPIALRAGTNTPSSSSPSFHALELKCPRIGIPKKKPSPTGYENQMNGTAATEELCIRGNESRDNIMFAKECGICMKPNSAPILSCSHAELGAAPYLPKHHGGEILHFFGARVAILVSPRHGEKILRSPVHPPVLTIHQHSSRPP